MTEDEYKKLRKELERFYFFGFKSVKHTVFNNNNSMCLTVGGNVESLLGLRCW